MRHYKVKPIQALERGLHVLAKLRENARRQPA
jgi:hypothetical protein